MLYWTSSNRPRGVDWVAFFEGAAYNVAILHGVSTALRSGAIPADDVKRLVAAVPAELITLV
jgi:hypothetical protein